MLKHLLYTLEYRGFLQGAETELNSDSKAVVQALRQLHEPCNNCCTTRATCLTVARLVQLSLNTTDLTRVFTR